MTERIPWHEYFLGLAAVVATRATCPRRRVGAVLVKDKRVIGTGYNGSAPGADHCDDVGCMMVGGHCARTTHAEDNAIEDAYWRMDTEQVRGASLYCTIQPCKECTKLAHQVGVTDIHWSEDYPWV